MSLPAPLTWTQLFEPGTRFRAHPSLPTWLTKQLAQLPLRNSAEEVDVGGAVGERADCGGYVGINSNASDQQFADQGFGYVRRFAVLPDLRQARWLVPLDSPVISSAGFSLYSPAKRMARLKVAAARLATRARLAVWYKDQIVIARRTEPELEKIIRQTLGDRSLRLAFSSGAPEPARNRKTSLAVIQSDGTLAAFGKLACNELTESLLKNEVTILAKLQARAVNAPRLVLSTAVQGHHFALQTPLSGQAVSTVFSEEKRSYLASLRQSHVTRGALDSTFCRTLESQTQELAVGFPRLADTYHRVKLHLAKLSVPSTIVHGDFAPWNLRVFNGKCAAFDWEYASIDGLPLIDETHFRLQVGYLMQKWTLTQATDALAAMADEVDLPLPAEHIRALQITYLVDNLARLYGEGYRDTNNEMVAFYSALLHRLVKGLKVAVPI